MLRLHHLLVAVILISLVQTGSAWWWRKKNCPQKAECPLKCRSGYAVDADTRGCAVTLCKCNDQCEHFNCPPGTECQRRRHCQLRGICYMYPTCIVRYQPPIQSPGDAGRDNQEPEDSEEQRTSSPSPPTTVTTSRPTTTTTTLPTTTTTTTTTVSPTTNGGTLVNQKTASTILCSDGQEPLQGINCNTNQLRSQPCPSNYQCESSNLISVSICCPVPSTLRVDPKTTTPSATVPTTQPPVQQTQSNSLCPNGAPHLPGHFCGRGGTRCGAGYTCIIDPTDRFAVCCPATTVQAAVVPASQQGLPMCEQPASRGTCERDVQRWYFNSQTGLCETFFYGGCRGNSNNFMSKMSCEAACGQPGESYCSLEKKVGRCRAAFPRYFFNSTSNQCESFIFGGCDGNGNNFVTVQQCHQYC